MGGILKYLPPLYLPLLPFNQTETVPQPLSVGHPTVFLPAVTKFRCNRRNQRIFTSGLLGLTDNDDWGSCY